MGTPHFPLPGNPLITSALLSQNFKSTLGRPGESSESSAVKQNSRLQGSRNL